MFLTTTLMTRFRINFLRCGLLGLVCLLSTPVDLHAALKHGHIRARTRGFVQRESPDAPKTVEVELEIPEEPPPQPVANVEVAPAVRSVKVDRRRAGLFRPRTIFRIERKFKARHIGYLADGPPNPLRFSDEDEVNSRPPSPALPEFTFLASEHIPYLIETPISDDGFDADMISEIVIELEPHVVVSGVIDTRNTDQEERVEFFNLEENQSTILRPEEVLIFFESDGVNSETTTVIPFAPANPSPQTIKSSARMKVVE